MDHTLEKILARVQKPGRYVGGEYNAVMKNKDEVDCRFAFCFPDTYEIGMSNLGLRILYGVANEMDGVWCERVFAPWGDMEAEMRREGLPLYALESGDPVAEFDIIGFSLGYEMAYTNVLNMLDLAGLPLRSKDRTELTPIVVAGGTSMYNPEPLSPFVDLVSLGEGEDVTVEMIQLYRKAKREGWSKVQFLREASQIQGLYVPSLYEVTYAEDGTISAITPKDGAPEKVTKRIVSDMDTSYYPVKTLVPSTEVTQDRVMLELFRGCIRGCRFCQAGMIYRPTRQKNVEMLKKYARTMLDNTGYEEISLSSLSSSDYENLDVLLNYLITLRDTDHVNVSLPSLRIDAFSLDVMSKVQDIKKSSLTFASEAGTQRLRDVINKGITDENLLEGSRQAFLGGWDKVKLYFMLGLPTETDEDLYGIADLAERISEVYFDNVPKEKRNGRVMINASASYFVPKPFTPFQWAPMILPDEFTRRARYVKDSFRAQRNQKSLKFSYHDAGISILEGVLARGDRRLGAAILDVYEQGGIFDAWTEYFDMQRYDNAFANRHVDIEFYTARKRPDDEVFPWEHLDVGVSRGFLLQEWHKAQEGKTTGNCRMQCSGCGSATYGGGVCFEAKN